MTTDGTPRIASFYHLGGNPTDWEVRQLWETSTQYYFVAVNRVINKTTYCTDAGVPSATKVVYTITPAVPEMGTGKK